VKVWVKVSLASFLSVGAVLLLILVFLEMRKERDREAETEKPLKLPPRVVIAADGGHVVKIDDATRMRSAIQATPLPAGTLAPETTAYGRFEEDPSTTFTLRAPAPGMLRSETDRPWPTLGDALDAGARIGFVDTRFAPTDRIDLSSRLGAAKAETEIARAALSAAKTAYERARVLNSKEKIVSDRAVQDAEVKVTEQTARLRANEDTIRLLEASVLAGPGKAMSIPLSTPRAGEVVQVFAQPGEAVESGQGILRTARYDRLLAPAVLPAGERLAGTPGPARILALGYEDQPLEGTAVSRSWPGAQGFPGEALLLRVEASGIPLRPGMAFQAWIPVSGEPRTGVVVPRSAVVRSGARSWIYLQVSEGEFSRRELRDALSVEGGWFVQDGYTPGQAVVTSGAQCLLSEELKSQIQVGEEEQRRG